MPFLPQINGEGNNDGSNDNFSWNCGVEGDDGANEGVTKLRFRQMRNFMLVLLASQGVPMMVMGEGGLVGGVSGVWGCGCGSSCTLVPTRGDGALEDREMGLATRG